MKVKKKKKSQTCSYVTVSYSIAITKESRITFKIRDRDK